MQFYTRELINIADYESELLKEVFNRVIHFSCGTVFSILLEVCAT